MLKLASEGLLDELASDALDVPPPALAAIFKPFNIIILLIRLGECGSGG